MVAVMGQEPAGSLCAMLELVLIVSKAVAGVVVVKFTVAGLEVQLA
jgi:hypothetical protein